MHISSYKNVKTTAQTLLLLQNDVHLQTIEPINATMFGLENPGHNNELVVYTGLSK